MLKHWFLGFDSSLDYANEYMPNADCFKVPFAVFSITWRDLSIAPLPLQEKFEHTDRGIPSALHGAVVKLRDPVPARLYVGFESKAEAFKKFNCYEFYFHSY